MTQYFGKIFIYLGIVLIIIGIFFIIGPKIPYIGRLPGDIYIKRENFVFYFPLATSIIISVILSLIFYLFRK
ncbi:MAG: DUF2905 domain-containing protein [Endomicrobiia bacterium]